MSKQRLIRWALRRLRPPSQAAVTRSAQRPGQRREHLSEARWVDDSAILSDNPVTKCRTPAVHAYFTRYIDFNLQILQKAKLRVRNMHETSGRDTCLI